MPGMHSLHGGVILIVFWPASWPWQNPIRDAPTAAGKVGKLARHDEEFRLELRKDLDAIGEKKPGRRSPYGPFFREYVFGFVEWMLSSGHAANLADAFARWPR